MSDSIADAAESAARSQARYAYSGSPTLRLWPTTGLAERWADDAFHAWAMRETATYWAQRQHYTLVFLSEMARLKAEDPEAAR